MSDDERDLEEETEEDPFVDLKKPKKKDFIEADFGDDGDEVDPIEEPVDPEEDPETDSLDSMAEEELEIEDGYTDADERDQW
jgi:hypothetical protein